MTEREENHLARAFLWHNYSNTSTQVDAAAQFRDPDSTNSRPRRQKVFSRPNSRKKSKDLGDYISTTQGLEI